jgi:glycerol-3-phosphate O-acyltransferase
MGLPAYVHNLRAGKERPDVFVVPCTINYPLVLEAETLIEDHLAEAGKSRYIIEDDAFSDPRRILDFITKLLSLQSMIRIVVSTPLDVFGNRVDEEGRSLDARDRPIDRMRYVLRGDEPVLDDQRDVEYTRELARSVLAAFTRDTVICSTHVLADAMLGLLFERNPGVEFYRLLRTGGRFPSFSTVLVYERIERLLVELRAAASAGRVRLDPIVERGDVLVVANDALAHLSSYHRRPAALRRGDRLMHEDRALLLYYRNRLPAGVGTA